MKEYIVNLIWKGHKGDILNASRQSITADSEQELYNVAYGIDLYQYGTPDDVEIVEIKSI